MALIDAATLNEFRKMTESAMPDTARIQHRVPVRDAGGVNSEAWETVATVKCRVSRVGDREERRERSGQLADRGTHTVALPLGTAVPLNGRIIADAETGGATWRLVLAVVGGTTPPSYAADLKVMCEETQPEPGEVIGDPA